MKQDFLIVVVAMLASAGNAKSCKCATERQEFRYATKNSPLIFSGQLVSVTNVKESGEAGAFTVRTFKFVPDKIWRGRKADTITLVSGNNNCDIMLEKGCYVIYTDSTQDLISCDRIISDNINKESQRLDRLFTRKRFKKLQVAS